MRSVVRLLILATFFSVAVLDAGRIGGENGARAHRSRLSAGKYHTCAIVDDGTVECWGLNSYGQLGDGTTINRLAPVPVSGLGTAVSIAAASFHTCAILANGSVRCWGLNDSGQLGNGTTISSPVPVAVTGLSNVVELAAGPVTSCAVRVDGSVWCWGAALGSGSPSTSAVPVQMAVAGAISVNVGANHACALMVNGSIRCWGENTLGQLGDFDNITTSTPRKVLYLQSQLLYDVNFGLEVSAGANFTCSRRFFGMVCWGDNAFDQFGIPSNVPPPDTKNYAVYAFWDQTITAFATGPFHTCAIVAGGTVVCSGRNDASQLGSPPPAAFPVTVPTVANAVEITAGLKHTCAAIADGSVRCWGDNSYGQHGNGTTGPAGIDFVTGLGGTFLGRGIAAGNQFSCGRKGTGVPACWGSGSQGQLGNSSSVSSPNPVAVTGISNAIAITTGNAHACLLEPTGAAKCWGNNAHGQLGNGTTLPSNKPVAVQGGLLFSAISAGDFHTCGIAANDVYCWGAGPETTGFIADSLTPVKMAFGSLVTDTPKAAISAGGNFTCALLSDGTVSCWGGPPLGQQVPKTVGGLYDVVAISAGVNHVCAVTAYGSVMCWGDNSRGQIGDNMIASASSPATVSGITDAVSVSSGAFFSCAVHADGTASCWGANDSGELSTVDSADHLTPSPVGSFRLCAFCGFTRVFSPLQGIAAITTGGSPSVPTQEHACALLAGGVLDCWGNNAQGEIGDGTTTAQPAPTVVNSFAANVDPDAALRNGRVAELTALINCEAGDYAHFLLVLEQAGTTCSGQTGVPCQGRLQRVPMTIPAQGLAGFQPGSATARIEAIVSNRGTVVEDTHWTRDVLLSISK